MVTEAGMTSSGGLNRNACVASCLLALSARGKNESVNRARSILVNRKHAVRELAKQCQCLVVKVWQRCGGNQPTKI